MPCVTLSLGCYLKYKKDCSYFPKMAHKFRCTCVSYVKTFRVLCLKHEQNYYGCYMSEFGLNYYYLRIYTYQNEM